VIEVDVSEAIEAAFKEDGIDVRTGSKPVKIEGQTGQSVTITLDDGAIITGTHILVAAGRVPVTGELGLEAAGVEVDERGMIRVDERLATTASNTFAIGEVAGTPMSMRPMTTIAS
jgi:pyruvate/2-oxoglutarate dehydrogenase complex dihydrolipoamide dehydrogenase (E3) component